MAIKKATNNASRKRRTNTEIEMMVYQIMSWLSSDEHLKPGGDANIRKTVMERMGVKESRASELIAMAWQRILAVSSLDGIQYGIEGRLWRLNQRILEVKSDSGLSSGERGKLIFSYEQEINRLLGLHSRRVDLTSGGKEIGTSPSSIQVVNNLSGLLRGLSLEELCILATSGDNQQENGNNKTRTTGETRRDFDAQPEQ